MDLQKIAMIRALSLASLEVSAPFTDPQSIQARQYVKDVLVLCTHAENLTRKIAILRSPMNASLQDEHAEVLQLCQEQRALLDKAAKEVQELIQEDRLSMKVLRMLRQQHGALWAIVRRMAGIDDCEVDKLIQAELDLTACGNCETCQAR